MWNPRTLATVRRDTVPHRAGSTQYELCYLFIRLLNDTVRSFGIEWYVQGMEGTYPCGVKRPELETDHLPPSVVGVKNKWGYTSTSSHVFMAW
jgi:hypothetical protein